MRVRCWLRADRHDGNDPIEAMVWLANKPVKGELIEVWNSEGGFRNSARHGNAEDKARGYSFSGEMVWLEVDQVVHAVLAPCTDVESGQERPAGHSDETLEIWVSIDGYSIENLEAAMGAGKEG